MRIFRLAFFAVLPVLAAVGSAQAANQTVTNAVDGFIRPAYRSFSASARDLGPPLAKFCDAHEVDALDAARAAFGQAVQAWSEVEIVRIGPVTEGNRLERILHWPDRKGIGLKQVQAALADEDQTATEPGRLAQKSVAMQGLGALEFLLFGTGAEDEAAWASGYRCRYAQAIAGNLAVMADEIATAWEAPDGFAATWENPSAENSLYRSDAESLTDLMDIFVQGTEMVRDVRLNGFLGEAADKDKPKQAIYWRSDNTANSLAANLQGLSKLFDASHLADLAQGDYAYLGGSIDFEFSNAQNALAQVKGKQIDAALADTALRQKLAYFGVVTSSLSDLFGTQLSGALGLSAGFSSLDGD